ncbi:response regulator [Cytobacillus solani]|uniref:Histidine kinase n=1 Tax=Cytobacillus solani TaxID=1637975 RepID=A0A0Q3VJR6_9BACI|nr:response regulator [Cytobacillus solani]KOP72092.1 histidine kinase [Bacillus sp. FJAT-21945]KQL22090.1 histidine kinase [Cytobacillus solani]USK57684.1 response regulator [Cytobacillus solani]
MRYFIVDDDPASRTMLKNIIIDGDLGVVIGEAESGASGLQTILTINPDVVLIDLLMPELDGIETIELLGKKGFKGQFIMISQIENKEMVGEAYEKGIEFFIHKPINRVEVQSILKKTAEQFRLRGSLLTIQESLANIGLVNQMKRQPSVKEIVLTILNDMGIIGEAGSDDIIAIIEFLMSQEHKVSQLPPLKDLYEAVSKKQGFADSDINKESKAMEQRIRRTLLTATNNLASLGAIDYTNHEFEYYAPRYFDFQEIRKQMIFIQEGKEEVVRIKINSKKFLQVLYLETLEKYNQN